MFPLLTLTCVRPTVVTVNAAQTRHTAGTAPALSFRPAPLLGCPALLRHRLYVPPAPSCALTSRSLSKSRKSYRVRSQGDFPVCLHSPSPVCSRLCHNTWAAQGPSPPRWHPRPQGGLGQREALPGCTLLQPTRSTKRWPAHGQLPAVPTPPHARVEGPPHLSRPPGHLAGSCSHCGTCCSVRNFGWSAHRPHKSCTSWRRCHLDGGPAGQGRTPAPGRTPWPPPSAGHRDDPPCSHS